MLLAITSRVAKRGESKRLLHRGRIPAILYGKGKETHPISLCKREFMGYLRNLSYNALSTSLFTLQDEEERQFGAIVKAISYDPITHGVRHLDFLFCDENQRVRVNVPLQFEGMDSCEGIKLGGSLHKKRRHVRLSGFLRDLPTSISVDVSSLHLNQSKKVRDLSLPRSVSLITPAQCICATIAK